MLTMLLSGPDGAVRVAASYSASDLFLVFLCICFLLCVLVHWFLVDC